MWFVVIIGLIAFMGSLVMRSGFATAECTAPFVIALIGRAVTNAPTAQLVCMALVAFVPIAAFETWAIYALEGPGARPSANIGLGIFGVFYLPPAILVSMVGGARIGHAVHRKYFDLGPDNQKAAS